MRYDNYFSLDFWKKFLEPVKLDKTNFTWIIIKALLDGLVGGIFALAMKNAVTALEQGDIKIFTLSTIILGIAMLSMFLPAYFFRNRLEYFHRGVQQILYGRYLAKYFHLENNISDKNGTGFFNNVIVKGTDNRTALLSYGTSTVVQLIIKIIIAISLFATYVGWVGILAICILFIFSFLITKVGNDKMIPTRKAIREQVTQADKNVIRMIMSKFEILSQEKEKSEINELNTIFYGMTELKIKESYYKIFTNDLLRGGVNAVQFLLILYVGYEILDGNMEIGLLAMVWMLSNQINGALQGLSDYFADYYFRMVFVEKLREIFDDAPLIEGYDDGKEFVYKKGDMVLDKISYDYGKGEVFHDFSLKISGGQKTALVGISGSGKSTLMKLISGYIHPQSGTISIDKQVLPNGQNDNFVSLKSYYQNIGYLTQEPSVFDGSIYDNLVYALNYEPSEDEIKKVLSDAQCQFVLEFPDGLESQIGEKGIRLSGGQRQRLAIAKIMLKNPQIILLDEPTSALDSFSEEEVTKAFDNLAKGKTVIIIAHRLQTVKQADTILVLEQGKVVESGTHSELVKKKGSYAKMLELQSGF